MSRKFRARSTDVTRGRRSASGPNRQTNRCVFAKEAPKTKGKHEARCFQITQPEAIARRRSHSPRSSQSLERGEAHDPGLDGVSITVTEVRISPDLRNATAALSCPSGGTDAGPVLETLARAVPFFRRRIAGEVDMRRLPTLSFQLDESFDNASHIDSCSRRRQLLPMWTGTRTKRFLSKKMGRRRKGRAVHGWLAVDKEIGITSAQAVWAASAVSWTRRKRDMQARWTPWRPGFCRSPWAKPRKPCPTSWMAKSYRFTACFGEARDTDDLEGRVRRPTLTAPTPPPSAMRWTGLLEPFLRCRRSIPRSRSTGRGPTSARAGEGELPAARDVEISRFELVDRPDADHAVFEVDCGKGTYIRSLARDLGKALGTELRARVGRCAARAAGRSVKKMRFRWIHWQNPCYVPPRKNACCPSRPRWTTSRRWP